MKRVPLRAFTRHALALLAVGAIVTGVVGEALASPSIIHYYSFNTTNNSGVASTNARFSVIGWNGVWKAPTYVPPAFTSMFWPAPTPTTALLFTHVTWTGGAAVPAGQTRWVGVRVSIPPTGSTSLSAAWFRWNAVSGTPGAPIPLGFKIGSAPKLYNHTDTPYSSAGPGSRVTDLNVENLVVRNARFANSPYAISLDSLRLDNATVLARFTESLDGTRAGPFTVAPGDSHQFNDVHASIGDPTPGARTILMRGTTEDWNGAQVDFVVQFVQPLAMPGSSRLGLLLLALLLATVGAVYLVRSRSLHRRAIS